MPPRRRRRPTAGPSGSSSGPTLLALATAPRCPTEHDEQCAVIAAAALFAPACPELRLLFAIPNGGFRSKRTAGRMKAEGVQPGVPDLFLPVARPPAHGLFLEMKRSDGGAGLSAAQRAWRDALVAQGYVVAVCHGAADAWARVRAYLGAAHLPERVP